jgi:hypothetical protein
MAGRKPGGPKFGGRAKGTPNKLTADVKAMILDALGKAGGADYLLEQSRENPSAFMTLVGKVLPLTLAGDKDAPITVARIELVAANANRPD